jgi:ComF family protein
MFSPVLQLLDLICPPICPVCHALIENGEPICRSCVDKILTPDGKYCLRCGGRRFTLLKNAAECSRCRTTKFRFRRAIVLGEYETDLRQIVLQMKIDKTGILAAAAAETLAIYRRTELQSAEIDWIIPVPMYSRRRQDRGVNSPEIIAEELGRLFKRPVAQSAVKRIRSTDLQYMLSSRARAKNVADAFAVTPSRFWDIVGSRQKRAIIGKNVLLVDDILTTGSTCNEVTKVLLAAGVRSVTVSVLARAEGFYPQHS